jgi:hypothetical protein
MALWTDMQVFAIFFWLDQTHNRWSGMDMFSGQNFSQPLYISIRDLDAGQTPSASPPRPLPADEKSARLRRAIE